MSFMHITVLVLALCTVAESEILNVAPKPVAEKVVEFVTIHQHTEITRRKRDDVDHVQFPVTMDFTIQFQDREINIKLKRNFYMTSDIKLSDGYGQIEHDFARKTGIYQDLVTRSAFVVQCEDGIDHCTLQGSLDIEGSSWTITPEGKDSKIHKATQTPLDLPLKFGSGISPTLQFNETSYREVPPNDHQRYRRTIPTECEIVECFAILDETVWQFYLSLTDNNDTAATESIHAYILALYTQADLHFDLVSLRHPGSCIRLYLSGIEIQKTIDGSWSGPTEGAGSSIDGLTTLLQCCTQAKNRSAQNHIDLTQCYTWKNIVFDNNPSDRSIGFIGSACNATNEDFRCGVIEAFGDKVELLIAHEVGHGIGTSNDGVLNTCTGSDFYIMADEQLVPDDALKFRNPWIFSPCSIDNIFNNLQGLPACLKDNSFSAAEYDNFINQPLAGTLYSVDEQCQFRVGLGSVQCDSSGQDREFIPNQCGEGINCTDINNGGQCIRLTRPFDGTPCGAENAFCMKGECFVPPTPPPSTEAPIVRNSKQNGETCECHTECQDPNAFCKFPDLKCSCIEGFYDDDGTDIGGTCRSKEAVGAPCPRADSCADPNAICAGTCMCPPEFFVDSGSCVQKKGLGEGCGSVSECSGNNVVCSNTCSCQDGFFNDGGMCVAFQSAFGATCRTVPDSCASGDATLACEPTLLTCVCAEGFLRVGSNCVEGAFGDPCSSNPDTCTEPHTVCSAGTCGCAPNTDRDAGKGKCVLKLGSACSNTDDCGDANAECVVIDPSCDKVCLCKDGFYNGAGDFVCSGSCVAGPAEGQSCDGLQDRCFDVCTDSFCNSTTRQCEAFPTTTTSTTVPTTTPEAGIGLGGLCLLSIQCAQFPRATCQQMFLLRRCRCNGGQNFVNVGGVCTRP